MSNTQALHLEGYGFATYSKGEECEFRSVHQKNMFHTLDNALFGEYCFSLASAPLLSLV